MSIFRAGQSSWKKDRTRAGLAALDVLATNVMIADTNLDIVYMNSSVVSLLKEAEGDLQRELPGFDVASLIGKNIDIFHKDPSHQHRLLERLAGADRVTIDVGQRVFDLIATPMLDGGRRIGTVVEWADAKQRLQNADYAAQVAAIGKSQAVIEFSMDGNVLAANDHFLRALGYTLTEIQGKHHSIFVDPAFRTSTAYKEFWASLSRGEYRAAEYKRIGKGDREVWIQASYNPILGPDGRPFKVVKFATDVTEQKLQNADYTAQIAAIGKSQAVIEFDMNGKILTANDNFLRALGYTLAEVRGKHHSMFVEPAIKASAEYVRFWNSLARGEYQAAEYKRIGKGGREVWIQASYNPVLDLSGKPIKVVKFATDVTKQVIARMKAEHVRAMMESVAAGAEELNSSVKEIAASMVKSKDSAEIAADRVTAADQSTHRLADAAQAMGGIVEMINNITSQINLLALNATIESARAGEAGRGFAVVANEVKNLAAAAKGATEKISTEIGNMRSISGDVVAALGAIKQSIETVHEYVASTAAAVEEQSAVANDMSASMQRAATEANSIGAAA
jgi:methyl-accepting chemotaxis protein